MRQTFACRQVQLLVAVFVLSGCATYEPAPIDPASMLQAQAARTVDLAAVHEEIAKLAPSAEWDGKRWDRLSLLALALVSNPEIQHARATAAAAGAEAAAARVAPGPTLTLTAEYSFNPPESSPWLYGIAGDLPLDVGARREARISIADLNARIALFDYFDAAWLVRLQIRQALAGYLMAQEQERLALTLNELRGRELVSMQHRLAAGAASYMDLERVRLAAAADQQRLNDVQARVAAALLQISAATGFPAGSLERSALTWSAIFEPQDLPDPIAARCVDLALLARPDVARASRRYDQAEQSLKSAVASQYPALHIGPGYTWERGLRKLPLSLGLSLPSLDLNRAAIAAAESRRAEAGRALEAVVAAAHNAFEAAQSGYRAAWVQLESSRQQRNIAERLATQAETALDAGAIDRIDWISAQLGRLTSRLDEIEAVGKVLDAEAAVEDALRRPLEGPELAVGSATQSSEDFACTPPALY